MKRFLIPAAALALGATAAPAATAATLSTDLPCYLSGGAISLTGAGWTAGATMQITGGFSSSTTVDPAGNIGFNGNVATLSATRSTPKTVTVNGTDGAQTAATSFKVVNGGAVWRGNGNPRKTVKWSFGGLEPGKPVYVHVRRDGRTLKTTRAGTASGPCGTATKRLKRLPVASSQIKSGRYVVFVDNRRKFSKGGLQYSSAYRIRIVTRF